LPIADCQLKTRIANLENANADDRRERHQIPIRDPQCNLRFAISDSRFLPDR